MLKPIFKEGIPVSFFSFSSNSFNHSLLSPERDLNLSTSSLKPLLIIPPSVITKGGSSTNVLLIFFASSLKKSLSKSFSLIFNFFSASSKISIEFRRDSSSALISLALTLLRPIFPTILSISLIPSSFSLTSLRTFSFSKNFSTTCNLSSISFLFINGLRTQE